MILAKKTNNSKRKRKSDDEFNPPQYTNVPHTAGFRRSARLRHIPAKFGRTSLSPETIIRACRAGDIADQREAPANKGLQKNMSESSFKFEGDSESDIDSEDSGNLTHSREKAAKVSGQRYPRRFAARSGSRKPTAIKRRSDTTPHSVNDMRRKPSAKYRKIRAAKKKYQNTSESQSSDDEEALAARDASIRSIVGELTSPVGTSHLKDGDFVASTVFPQKRHPKSSRLRAGPSRPNANTPQLATEELETTHTEIREKSRSLSATQQKKEPDVNTKKVLTVARFLRNLDLGHKVSIFHQLHLRSDRDLKALSDNIGDSVRREELRRSLESKGLSIIDWWTVVKGLSA